MSGDMFLFRAHCQQSQHRQQCWCCRVGLTAVWYATATTGLSAGDTGLSAGQEDRNQWRMWRRRRRRSRETKLFSATFSDERDLAKY